MKEEDFKENLKKMADWNSRVGINNFFSLSTGISFDEWEKLPTKIRTICNDHLTENCKKCKKTNE